MQRIKDHQLVKGLHKQIKLPSVVRDLLMLEPSLSLVPTAPVLFALSDPARSTRDILDTVSPVTPEARSVLVKVIVTVNTAWDRLDWLFMLVAATVRYLFPSFISFSIS